MHDSWVFDVSTTLGFETEQHTILGALLSVDNDFYDIYSSRFG